MAGKMKSGKRIGRNKNRPTFSRWKDAFNRGKGLKHRRMARRLKDLAKAAAARSRRQGSAPEFAGANV